MDLGSFDALATSFAGVRRTGTGSRARWQYQGRLIARELGGSLVAIRAPFEARRALLEQFHGVFSVPKRFAKHMIVVADLAAAEPAAIEAALTTAWHLQASHG